MPARVENDRVRCQELFELLDTDEDGALSRENLRAAAQRLRWHWHEAPLYAVLDAMTIDEPLSSDAFVDCLQQMSRDLLGPYGRVLRRSAVVAKLGSAAESSLPRSRSGSSAATGSIDQDLGDGPADSSADVSSGLIVLLADALGDDIADRYRAVLQELDRSRSQIPAEQAALLIIDPQKSFTSGAWKRSFGPGAAREVMSIQLAFDNCGRVLRNLRDMGGLPGRMSTMFTRCPFPPQSYEWDERLRDVVDERQLYFVKPGNSAMWPPSNGYREWVQALVQQGKRFLVMGGCTMNSCVRVSSIETQAHFSENGLRVVVDLSLSGSRMGNYLPSFEYGGLSSAESAIREMVEQGVAVVPSVSWT